ncbi:MAG: CpcT/CpeT family chromophore lyase, partial [Rhodospirillaceae bacterium]
MGNIFVILMFSLLALPVSAQTEVERDFDTFVRWFSGHWDNEIQIFNEDIQGLPDEMRHKRIHMKYEAVENDNFPGVLFVIENYGKDGLQGDLNYVSVHHFFVDIERQAITHELWFKNDGDWSYLAGNALAAADIGPEDYRFNPQCTMYWKREGSQFKGKTDPDACVGGVDGKETTVDATGILSPPDLWRSDLVYDMEGNRIRGLDIPERFRKARF